MLLFQRRERFWQGNVVSTGEFVGGRNVQRTLKMDDTIKYLARMTAMLTRSYESKPLRVIPTRILTAQNYLPLLNHLRECHPDEGHYITYPAFASLASKSELMTLRDVFLKMLMCIRGVTGEKALEIQRRWPTPQAFVQAFEALGVKDRENLVSDQMQTLVTRKKIAMAMVRRPSKIASKKLHMSVNIPSSR